ncbi:MAG TPA: nuclear transport factor 2 family protein [Burkholderiales bacterium]|nr:nuclear transport factor 2 family protein [Burkholderiales bacterium]
MNNAKRDRFDFAAFKRAFVTKDVASWAGFFANNAEWIEYRHSHPPHSPRRMVGKTQIEAFLSQVKASNVVLSIEDEVVGPTRTAFRVWCTLPNGKRIIEHVILHFTDGKITRQVDVEAWD